MPITPAALKARVKAITFDYQGDEVNLEYHPAALSPDTADQLKAWLTKANAAETDETTQAVLLDFGAWVCTILSKWDYMEDDKVTMQPITPENIAAQVQTFPDFILAVLVAIVNDRNLGNANGTPTSGSSGDTSSPVEKLTATDSQVLTSAQASLTPSASSSQPDGSTEPPVLNG